MRRVRSGSSIPSTIRSLIYLARVFAEEESARCQFGTPIVGGDQAAVPWSAQTRLAGGGAGNLAGVSLLRFSDDGLVLEERDFWNQS
jgi:endonuclease/exonuclease/phosphatase (EEP) superfamily protein YafD